MQPGQICNAVRIALFDIELQYMALGVLWLTVCKRTPLPRELYRPKGTRHIVGLPLLGRNTAMIRA